MPFPMVCSTCPGRGGEQVSLSPMLLSSLSLGEAAVPAPDAGWEGFCHEELAPGGDKGGETPPLSGGVGALCCLLTAAAASVDGQGASPLFSLRRPPLPASRRGQSSARRSAEGPGWAALPVLPAVGPPRFPSRRPSAAPASVSSAASPGPSWMCCAAGPAGNRRGMRRSGISSGAMSVGFGRILTTCTWRSTFVSATFAITMS